MGTLDPDMGALVATAMVAHGLDVRCGVAVTGFEPETVLTDDGPIGADLVVLGIGVAPNAALAAEAGLELGVKGAIRVDRAAGARRRRRGVGGGRLRREPPPRDRPAGPHRRSGPSPTSRAGSPGSTSAAGYATFAGVLGTAITKLCATEIARTGLGEAEAERAGFVRRGRPDRDDDDGRLLPRRRADDGQARGRARDRPPARRPDRRRGRRGQAHRHAARSPSRPA